MTNDKQPYWQKNIKCRYGKRNLRTLIWNISIYFEKNKKVDFLEID